jgi:hypothetical protein
MKAWRGKLEAHVATWSSRIPSTWLARFAYRFDDVTSAAEILNRGMVYSRKRAEELGCIVHDQASPQVIEGTPERHREFVRLYFRPKTPTQWHAEGIRPRPSITPMGAHCPVPVFLCFDFVETLAMDGTLFSRRQHGRPWCDLWRHEFSSTRFLST